MWTSSVILVAITGLTLFGDYAIKVATTKENGFLSAWFIFGALLYGLPAIGWFFLMRSHSLAVIGVMYSASTIILMTALGYFAFKEAFGWNEAVGISLAVAAVVVLSYK